MTSSTGESQEIARGVAVEALPNAQFIVDLETGRQIRAYVSGKMRKNKIRIGLGEKVEVEMLPVGEIHRIIRRL